MRNLPSTALNVIPILKKRRVLYIKFILKEAFLSLGYEEKGLTTRINCND
jgi:hypothetical protein